MLIDQDLQILPSASHVQSDGSNIGGVDPKSYGSLLVPGPSPGQSLLLWTSGNTGKPTDYPAWMWYPATPRSILPNGGRVRLVVPYTPGGDLTGLNAVETDLLFVINGWKYNGSCQFVQGQGFQIGTANSGWASTGFNPGLLQANFQYNVSVDYQINETTHTLWVLQITRNGLAKAINATGPAVDTSQGGTVAPWKDGAYFQAQMSSMPNGNQWTLKLTVDVEYP